MRAYVLAVILVGIGVVLAFPLFSMSYYTMVRTSTPELCASCHAIKPAVVAWRSSSGTIRVWGGWEQSIWDGVVTDLVRPTSLVTDKLRSMTAVVLEFNHDVEMLIDRFDQIDAGDLVHLVAGVLIPLERVQLPL
mgnify:CR=1 FL=1